MEKPSDTGMTISHDRPSRRFKSYRRDHTLVPPKLVTVSPQQGNHFHATPAAFRLVPGVMVRFPSLLALPSTDQTICVAIRPSCSSGGTSMLISSLSWIVAQLSRSILEQLAVRQDRGIVRSGRFSSNR